MGKKDYVASINSLDYVSLLKVLSIHSLLSVDSYILPENSISIGENANEKV